MTYSDSALAFSTIPPGHQVRLEDRVSFAYVEHSAVVQDRTGVVALKDDEGQLLRLRVQLPVAGMAVLILGPGTSITAAALTSCTRSGCTVLISGGGGVPAYTHATPLTHSARWAIAQARLVANDTHQLHAALALYKRQLNLDVLPGGSINVMRGLEGRSIRDLYKRLASQHKVKNFKRLVAGDDPVNIGLNIANSMLYGCAASVCAVIGINPALGIIHRGDARSFLYDLADLYKPSLTIPLAFACAQEEDVPLAVRKRMRKEIHQRNLLSEMLGIVMELLEPYLPGRDDDRLIGDRGETEVSGHTSYGDG